MGTPAPKPDNFEQLAATWDNPAAFALERAKYYAQLRAEGILPRDVDRTEPRHERP